MRDSNSRGLAPDTLSKSVGLYPAQVADVCCQQQCGRAVAAGRCRTRANETRTETGRARRGEMLLVGGTNVSTSP